MMPQAFSLFSLFHAALETTQSELFELKNKYDDGVAAKYVHL